MRVFFAIPLGDDRNAALKSSLVHADVQIPGQAVDPSGWHITLFFIKSIGQENVERLIRAAAAKTWPEEFSLILDRFGAFPNPLQAQVLWCGVGEGSARVHELAAELSRLMHEMGYPSDAKFYNGHLTLSRLKHPLDVSGLLKKYFSPVRIVVDRFSLFNSRVDLGPQHYEEIATFRLPTAQ